MTRCLSFLFVLGFAATTWATEVITVTNEDGQPISGAEVLFGHAYNDPFPGNYKTTDINGRAEAPEAWTTALPVSVSADGYIKNTLLNVEPASFATELTNADSRNQLEVKGNATTFPNLKKDGKVDFALVFPSLKRRQLAQFDMSTIISPEVDTIKVITEKMQVPSNLSLPTQQENYVVPITLSKPEYRMFVKKSGTYEVTAIHGQFPLKQVVDAMRAGKPFFEVLNMFRMIGGGQRNVAVKAPMAGQDIPVNQIPYDRGITVEGPVIPENQIVISFSLVNKTGLLYPTDLKYIKPGEKTQLFVPSSSTSNKFVSLTMDKTEADKVSFIEIVKSSNPDENPAISGLKAIFGSLLKMVTSGKDLLNQGVGGVSIAFHPENQPKATMLDLVARPTVQGQKLLMTPPRMVSGINALSTYVVLSEVERPPAGERRPDRRFRLWEVMQPGWVSEINLPDISGIVVPGKGYQWEVLFLGQSSSDTSEEFSSQGGSLLDQVTHVTRNTFDF